MAEFRVGRKVCHALYRDDVFIGSCITPEYAAEIVALLNAAERLAEELGRVNKALSTKGYLEWWSGWDGASERVDAALAQWREATGGTGKSK